MDAGENRKWCSCYGKESQQFLKKLNRELPHDPAIPLLGIYTKRIKSSDSNRYLYTNGHSSIIHKSQQVKTTQMSMHR